MFTKKITTISLFIFWAVVVSLLTAGFVFYQDKKIGNSVVNQVAGSVNQTEQLGKIILDTVEIAKHNLATDCWVIVRGKIYNVTSFASLHSGGDAAIVYNCGKDGTVAYDTKGGNGQHKAGDINILANYYMGDLGQSVNLQTVQQNMQNINNIKNNNIKNYEEYDD